LKKKKLILVVCLFIAFQGFSQNIEYAKGLIDTLTSPEFYGRGYVNSGEKIAANFIAGQFKNQHIEAFQNSYFQPFIIPINTLPGIVELRINDKIVSPGTEFLVSPDSPPADTAFNTYSVLNEKTLKTSLSAQKFHSKNYRNQLLVIDTGFKKMDDATLAEAALLLKINDKNMAWHVSLAQEQNKQVIVSIKRSALPKKIKKVEIKVDAKFEKNYLTQNVVGYLPGKVYPDTFLVIGGHYDHLGMMGDKTYFPGANDNASGTAMLLDLARYFSDTANMGKYSIAFIFFTGEEAGLLGSEYYTGHPLFPLKNIKFMLNLDMVGTGSEGIKVVNGSVLKKEFEQLKSINEQHNYLKTVSERGEAANSDHYYFYKNGVKSFFIYTLGDEYKEYHTVTDKADGLPLTKYPELFRLIVDFIHSF
jgi:aminopeptidase YwaD